MSKFDKTDIFSDGLAEKALVFAEHIHAQDSGGHDLSHIRRVLKNAEHIMSVEKFTVDKELVRVCCALHDVDDRKLKKVGDPPYKNVMTFCAENGLDGVAADIIIGIIDKVSFTSNGSRDDSICAEAKIVQDADRLDALGAVGIARAFAYGGSKGRRMFGRGSDSTVEHFYNKLFLLPGLMYTETAKTVAADRVAFMKEFLAMIEKETT